MKKLIMTLLCLVLVCRIFVISNIKNNSIEVGNDITQWLQGKKIISVTQSSERNINYITIIAEAKEIKNKQ